MSLHDNTNDHNNNGNVNRDNNKTTLMITTTMVTWIRTTTRQRGRCGTRQMSSGLTEQSLPDKRTCLVKSAENLHNTKSEMFKERQNVRASCCRHQWVAVRWSHTRVACLMSIWCHLTEKSSARWWEANFVLVIPYLKECSLVKNLDPAIIIFCM